MTTSLGSALLLLTLVLFGLATMVGATRVAFVQKVLTGMFLLAVLLLVWPAIWHGIVAPTLAGAWTSLTSWGGPGLGAPTVSAPGLPALPPQATDVLVWYGTGTLGASAIYGWALWKERTA